MQNVKHVQCVMFITFVALMAWLRHETRKSEDTPVVADIETRVVATTCSWRAARLVYMLRAGGRV